MHDIALIPGAGYAACSVWPLQAIDDPTIHPIDYQRRGTISHRYVLEEYAERVYNELLKLDRSVDLYAWSMGAPISLGVAKLAETRSPELVRNIIMITPAVFHGKPCRNFHLSVVYASKLLWSFLHDSSNKTAALQQIRERIPNFTYVIAEDINARIEAFEGVIKIPANLNKNRIRLYYASDDDVIPEDITLDMAKRTGLNPIAIHGYGHELPLLDTKGEVLRLIRQLSP
jgi:pimeloyl-ACP methyl ester carboxylesterase